MAAPEAAAVNANGQAIAVFSAYDASISVHTEYASSCMIVPVDGWLSLCGRQAMHPFLIARSLVENNPSSLRQINP